MFVYFLILGSNFRFPVSNIYSGITLLERYGKVGSPSSLYVTEPVEKKYQTGFINCGLKYKSVLGPDELIWVIKNIEREMGRSFTSSKVHRPLDIDMAAGCVTHKSDQVILPHPALKVRRFMLIPLCELEPDFPATEDGRTFEGLLATCDDNSMVFKI